jgi:antitoxin component YwqK of YwqJK toxin-antitoxin module
MRGKYGGYHENGCELTNVNSKRKNQSPIDSFGQLEIICSHLNGKKNGEHKSYHENGELHESCVYDNGIKIKS